MIGYKLFRQKPSGQLGPLFINRRLDIPMGVWLESECHPTPGFAVRQGWHATAKPRAPHLKERLSSGETRVWAEVELQDVERYDRPESQGGTWLLARRLMVLRVIKLEES